MNASASALGTFIETLACDAKNVIKLASAFGPEMVLHEDMPLEILQNRDPTKAIPPLHGALLKNEQDVMLFERLAFMARRKV